MGSVARNDTGTVSPPGLLSVEQSVWRYHKQHINNTLATRVVRTDSSESARRQCTVKSGKAEVSCREDIWTLRAKVGKRKRRRRQACGTFLIYKPWGPAPSPTLNKQALVALRLQSSEGRGSSTGSSVRSACYKRPHLAESTTEEKGKVTSPFGLPQSNERGSLQGDGGR